MSSFVIGKVEYEKAGGFVAGLLTELRERGLYVPEEGRYADKNDYRKWFIECYRMNAESVAEQYGEEYVLDDTQYDQDFEQYYKFGKNVAVGRDRFRENIAELHSFFRSSLYQTEKDEYADKMELLYKRIMFNLMGELLRGIQTESWGEFTVKKPEHSYERII